MNALFEALKEAARVTLMAVIPIVIMAVDFEARTFTIDWFLVQFTALVTFLRFVDSWLHEVGKERDHEGLKGGLTRF